ncbi:hypothetical protein J2S09_001342 [Bacillus fengqiuensis]|nr:hypothetical protein [Bacillus fengqiuensis]
MLSNLFKKKSKVNQLKEQNDQNVVASMGELLQQLKVSDDFVDFNTGSGKEPFWVAYFTTLTDSELIHDYILPNLDDSIRSLEELKKKIPIEQLIVTDNTNEVKQRLMSGGVVIRFHEHDECVLLASAPNTKFRQVGSPEIEFNVIGPQEAFVEALSLNINLIRKRLPIDDLKVKNITIGKTSKTQVSVMYVQGVANDENLQTVMQRLADIYFDQILDSSYLEQMIQDNSRSLFPQIVNTERPDRVAAALAEGKIAILSDGSPNALIAPSTITEFFGTLEDYNLNWLIATAFRLIRGFAVAFSIFATPIYVAVLTYHYEIIPKDLLQTLISSRTAIPFPPIIEAIILELSIELLREAGARLPTKVGQTLGIVGGIVIGQASVEAGITSNILLIIVALAALASFTTPTYKMGNTIRLLRFPFLIFAQILGLVGIMICSLFVLSHLMRLTSLGRPYLEPIYPPRLKDLKDSIIRLPFTTFTNRPVFLQTESKERFKPQQKKQKVINDFTEDP